MGLVRAINKVAALIERIASLCLAAITAVIFISSLARYLFAAPIPDSHAISSLLLGVAVLWGLASVTWHDGHISVDIVWLLAGPRLRWFMDVCGLLLTGLFLALFAWMLLGRIETVLASGQYTVDLRLAIWPFYLMAWAGVVAAVVLCCARLCLLVFRPLALPERAGVGSAAEEAV
ncbi:MAG TPA: TRAP transporter small permease subunit [Gammaproteobacteria bacterium]|nr:TRAP transporter small permease subunit [Gammaproteobacteria bacterium]